MSDLVAQARGVLERSGFATGMVGADSVTCDFEDVSIMGRLHVLDSAGLLLEEWERLQDQFLREHANQFSRDPTKAWNLYSVFLTARPADESERARLFAVEENFRGTRKIARAGIGRREDLERALAPILPLQNLLSIGTTDATRRLVERLAAVNPVLGAVVSDSPAESLAADLLGKR
jgi:hypothetical protein